MKIAILYICTGKYDIFWKDFYDSAEIYFFKNCPKTYFVFTDSNNIKTKRNVIKIEQENLGWPGNTLFRFNMFYKIIDKLTEYDYIFFFNANCKIVDYIDKEILPEDEELIVVNHPGFYNKKRKKYTYEKRKKSLAYISKKEGLFYVSGGFFGGNSINFKKMILELKNNIEEDYKNGIIAIWHDESHLNKYILSHSHKLLNSGYFYPEGWNIPFTPKVLVKDKNNYGGHKYLRSKESE